MLTYRTGGSTSVTGTIAVSLNAWHHIAVSKASGTILTFLDGTIQGTLAQAVSLVCTGTVKIGRSYNSASTTNIRGYIDDLRITKGVARYTANFTPPTAAFPHGAVPGTPTENARDLFVLTGEATGHLPGRPFQMRQLAHTALRRWMTHLTSQLCMTALLETTTRIGIMSFLRCTWTMWG